MRTSMFFRGRTMIQRLLAVATVVAFLAAGCSNSAEDDVEASLDEAAQEAADVVDDAGGDAEELVDEAAEAIDEEVDDVAEIIDERSAMIVQTLRDNDLESLASAVEQFDATELIGDGSFTFFAPNDEAFLELGADELADLLSDPAQLVAVLQDHILAERLDAASLSGGATLETRGGRSLLVTIDGDTVMIEDATVVEADIDAADGVIHVVDRVIMP